MLNEGKVKSSQPSLCETLDKQLLGRDPDRSWCHLHTTINLPLFSTFLPSNSCCLDGRTVENKGKLILTEIFPSVQKHDI